MKHIIKVFRKFGELPTGYLPTSVLKGGRNAIERLHSMYHRKLAREAISPTSLVELEEFVRDHAVRMKAPLVLISQIERSGGTLLSQLFDGHPDLAAYPHELRFGFLEADNWPEIDLSRQSDQLFLSLIDLKMRKLAKRGFRKGRAQSAKKFLLSPYTQHTVFCRQCEVRPPASERDVFDYFFSAFFNAWLDYQGGPLDQKRWITAFAPRLADNAAGIERFFDCYPDGRLVQIVRAPETWLSSAARHPNTARSDQSAEALLSAWKNSAEAILRNKARYKDKVLIISFEDLVNHTERSMRRICSTLGLDYEPIAAMPTFNGGLTVANSSFSVNGAGITKAATSRKISKADAVMVREYCKEAYDAVRREFLRP